MTGSPDGQRVTRPATPRPRPGRARRRSLRPQPTPATTAGRSPSGGELGDRDELRAEHLADEPAASSSSVSTECSSSARWPICAIAACWATTPEPGPDVRSERLQCSWRGRHRAALLMTRDSVRVMRRHGRLAFDPCALPAAPSQSSQNTRAARRQTHAKPTNPATQLASPTRSAAAPARLEHGREQVAALRDPREDRSRCSSGPAAVRIVELVPA